MVEKTSDLPDFVIKKEREETTVEVLSEESSQQTEGWESAGAETFQPSTPARNIPDSLPLERQAAGSQFWTANSARQSPGFDGQSSPTDSVRELLLQKRVSLTHTPDIIRVLEREQQVSRLQGQHEFQ